MQTSQTAAPQPPTVIAKVQPHRSSSASLQPASFLVVDDQQSGLSRQLMFALSPTKTLNPPSVASGQQEDSQHNTSGLSSLFRSIPSVLQYQQIDTPQPFSLSQLQPAQLPVPTATQQEQTRPQPVQPAESAQISRLACIKSHQKALLRATQILAKQLLSYLFFPKQKTPSNTNTSSKYKTKLSE